MRLLSAAGSGVHPALLELTPLPAGDAGQLNGEDLAFFGGRTQDFYSYTYRCFVERSVRVESIPHAPCGCYTLNCCGMPGPGHGL